MMSGSEVRPVQTLPKTEMYPGSHFDVNECDIGSVEQQPPPTPTLTPTATPTTTPEPGSHQILLPLLFR